MPAAVASCGLGVANLELAGETPINLFFISARMNFSPSVLLFDLRMSKTVFRSPSLRRRQLFAMRSPSGDELSKNRPKLAVHPSFAAQCTGVHPLSSCAELSALRQHSCRTIFESTKVRVSTGSPAFPELQTHHGPTG